MDTPDKLATLGTQDTEGRNKTTQKTNNISNTDPTTMPKVLEHKDVNPDKYYNKKNIYLTSLIVHVYQTESHSSKHKYNLYKKHFQT